MTQAIYAQYGVSHETLPSPSALSVYQRNPTNNGWQSVSVASLIASASGAIAFSGVTFTGFPVPTQPDSPATKGYVDGLIQGLSFKDNVVAATTAALAASTYANGASGVGATLTATSNGAFPAQDGVTVALSEGILVKDQASGLQNGIYLLTQVGDGSNPWVLTRRTDADAAVDLGGAFVYVDAGTVNGGGSFALPLRESQITVGTTALAWSLFSSASQIAAGSPYLTRSGNTISAVVSALAGDVQAVGSAASAGSVGKLADVGHVHAHGNQTDGAMHAAANGSTNGFLTAAHYLLLASSPTVIRDTQTTNSATLTNVGAAQYTPAAGRVTLLAVVTGKENGTNAWGASFIFVAHYKSTGSVATVESDDPLYLVSYDGGQGVVAKFNVTSNDIHVAVTSNTDTVHWTATLYAFPST